MRLFVLFMILGLGRAFLADVAFSQELLAQPDSFYVPRNEPLVVDNPGVLDNDTVDQESAFEMGASAVLLQDVGAGDLSLAPDGSFSYSPAPHFDGTDYFIYQLVLGDLAVSATVTLSACGGGPDVFFCWREQPFMDMAAQLGYHASFEGFEDDAAWGGVRTPNYAESVTNQGVTWRSNHTGGAVLNPISTTPGPPRTGQWAVYDPYHGQAEGTPGNCDVDNPPEFCLYHDGVTGEVAQEAPPLVGVGGYFSGNGGAQVDVIL